MCKHEEISDGIFYGQCRYYKIKLVHIDTIKVGDTVLCEDGIIRTVGKNNIKYGGFMGTGLFGDSYHSGYKKVKKVIFLTRDSQGNFYESLR